MKDCILLFPQEGDLGIFKNYRCITLTSVAFKVYDPILHNYIKPKIEKILWKNQNGFWSKHSTTSSILSICRNIEGVRAKNLEATLLLVDVSKAFDSIHRGKVKQILPVCGLAKEIFTAIIMLLKNNKAMVHSTDRDRLLWHSHWSLARRHISAIWDYNLPWLRISNIHSNNTPQKTAVRSSASHPTNHSSKKNKICRAQQENWKRTH